MILISATLSFRGGQTRDITRRIQHTFPDLLEIGGWKKREVLARALEAAVFARGSHYTARRDATIETHMGADGRPIVECRGFGWHFVWRGNPPAVESPSLLEIYERIHGRPA